MSAKLHVETGDGVCTLTIDNPGKRNALSPSFLSEVTETLSSFRREEDWHVVVLRGRGTKAFSSGYDISQLDDRAQEGDRGSLDRALESLEQYEYPTIAMINGVAAGGAVELAATCDLRIAVEEARIGIPSAKLGVVYGATGIKRVMDLIGPAYTKELLFSGELIEAPRAHSIGLVNRVVEREQLEEETYGLARTMASNAPLSLKGTKQIIQALLAGGSLSESRRAWANELRREAFQSEDHQRAKRAFAENRTPEFQGE